MSRPNPAQTYLADTEATHLDSYALPGAIVLQLRRGRPSRSMFIELSVSEAVQHWQMMGDLIRKAGALEQQPSYADSASKL